ncbi:Junction plakoglobin, partial [Geodia barretti]
SLSLWHPSSLSSLPPPFCHSFLPLSLLPLLCQAGGMQALSRHLGHRSTRLVHNILHTLRNLSDMATKQDHLDDLCGS